MSAYKTLLELRTELIEQGIGRRFVFSYEWKELIESLPADLWVKIIDDIPPYDMFAGLPLIPTEGGYFLWYSCEYCGERHTPENDHCWRCGAPI